MEAKEIREKDAFGLVAFAAFLIVAVLPGQIQLNVTLKCDWSAVLVASFASTFALWGFAIAQTLRVRIMAVIVVPICVASLVCTTFHRLQFYD